MTTAADERAIPNQFTKTWNLLGIHLAVQGRKGIVWYESQAMNRVGWQTGLCQVIRVV